MIEEFEEENENFSGNMNAMMELYSGGTETFEASGTV